MGLSTSYYSLSQICCFSCISPSCMPIIYYKVTVPIMIKPCFNFKSARYTIKDQILKIGQILDISDHNPVQTKIGHPKFFTLGLGRYRSENLGKMTPLELSHIRASCVDPGHLPTTFVIRQRASQIACTLIDMNPFLLRQSSASVEAGHKIGTCVQSIAQITQN